MSELLLTSVQYGGYISTAKFIAFVVLFFAWIPLVGWVYKDARLVGTKESYWTVVVFVSGAAAAVIWLLVPIFIIGMLLYLIAVIISAVLYLMHRDSKVPESQRVMRAEFVKRLFSKKEEEVGTLEGLTFITSNNNNVPVPEPGTAEFITYKAAYDIFNDAIWRRASDIIFLPAQQNYSVIYYIDGASVKQPIMARSQAEQLLHLAKNLANLDTAEKRKPQKGKFRVRRNEENTEWEIITAGSTAGEQARFKQTMQREISRLTDIELAPDQYEQLSKIRELKKGLFIVSGVRKTGVSTTFYSLLKAHDPYLNVISTLERQQSENPPNITQNVFTLSDSSTTTYAKKLQALLKLHTDVIGIADCNDSETAKLACETAKDRLAYITLEAENVIKALGKLVKLTGDKNLVADVLLGIANQRLLRKLCDQCKEAYEPNKDLLRKFNIPADRVKVLYRAGKPQTDKRGNPIVCQICQGTGFVGRIPIFEVITLTDDLRNAIKQAKSLSEISTEFRRAKMLYLQEQALKKVIAGITAINEMVRVLSAAKEEDTKKSEEDA